MKGMCKLAFPKNEIPTLEKNLFRLTLDNDSITKKVHHNWVRLIWIYRLNLAHIHTDSKEWNHLKKIVCTAASKTSAGISRERLFKKKSRVYVSQGLCPLVALTWVKSELTETPLGIYQLCRGQPKQVGLITARNLIYFHIERKFRVSWPVWH